MEFVCSVGLVLCHVPIVPAEPAARWPVLLPAGGHRARSNRLAGLVACCAMVVLTGCAVGPDYVPPCSCELQPAYQTGQPGTASPADLTSWWTHFDDPVLDRLVTMAWQQNLDLRAASFRILQARAQWGVVRGGLFPQADGTGSFDYRRISTNANPFITRPRGRGGFERFSTGFDAAWEIDLFGKIRRAVEAADADFGVRVEDYRDVFVTLVADVASNYVTLRLLQERLRIARANLAAQQQTLEMVRQRQAAGLVGQLDVAQAESNVHTTASNIPLLQQDRQVTLNRLSILLARSPDQELAAWIGDGPLPADPGVLGLGVPADLIRRRPDIRRAEREVAAASARIGVAAADRYPQFTLRGTITVDSRNVSSLFEMASLAHNVGPAFRWDLLNFGRVLNNVRLQRARYHEAVVNYQNVVLLAVEEVENGLVAYRRALDRAESLRHAARAASTATRLSTTQYERGLITFQTLLDSQRQRLQSEESLAIARGTARLSLIRTFKAAGGGWQSTKPAALPAPRASRAGRTAPFELHRLPSSEDEQAVP